jgi:hypothetical protein
MIRADSLNRPALRLWLSKCAREALTIALDARRRGHRTLARRWITTARSLRVAAHACGPT